MYNKTLNFKLFSFKEEIPDSLGIFTWNRCRLSTQMTEKYWEEANFLCEELKP